MLFLSQPFTKQVMLVAAWVAAGWFVAPSRVVAQPAVSVAPPHELVQPAMAEQAQELDPERDWVLTDAPAFRGKVLRWSDPSGLIFFHDRFGRPATFPLRQFDEAGRKTLDELLGPHRELMSRLREKEPVERPQGMSLGEGQGVENALPIDVTEDSVYWRVGLAYVRSPIAHFAASDVELLRKSLQERDALPMWHGKLPQYRFRGQLIGQTRFGGNRTAYVFRRFRSGPHDFIDFTFLVSKDQLAPADQERAESFLAAKPGNAVLAREKAPRMWWPLGHWTEPPKRPLALEGDTLKFRQPVRGGSSGSQQAGADETIQWAVSQTSLSMLPAGAELLIKQVLEEERLTAEDKSLSGEKLAKALDEFTEKTIAERPFYFLSPLNRWGLRESNPNHLFIGRVVAEQGLYWIFSQDKSATTFAVLKSEIADEYVAFGEEAIEQIARYLKEHPDVPQPELETKFRVIRSLPYSVMTCEPLAIENESLVRVKIPDSPEAKNPTVDLQRLHFLDAQELRLVLSGEATTRAAVGSVASSASRRDELIAAEQLRQLENKQRSWTLSEHATGTRMRFGFNGILLGKHQDDFVFRQDATEFVVDPDALEDKARAEAEELLDQLATLRKRAGVEARELTRPALRMWGYLAAQSILSSQLRFTEDGALLFVDRNGKEVQIPAANVTMEFRREVALQAELAKSFRTTAKADLSAEDEKRVAELKQRLRTAETERLAAEAAANALEKWHLKGSAVLLPGRFIRFDGDDVIMKIEKGAIVRVLKIAFTDESLERLEELAADPEYQKQIESLAQQDPAEVTLRIFRSSGNSILLPGTPISFDSRSMSVKTPEGLIFSYDLAKIHPRDVSEMRSQMCLKANGLQRDDQIDERLQQPIDPKEVLQAPVALSDKWRKRLDEMLQPRELVWSQRKLETSPGERVLCVSPDGTHVILGPSKAAAAPAAQQANAQGELRVVEVSTGKAQPVAAAFTPAAPVFLTGDNRELVHFEGGKLKQIDLASGNISFSIDDLKEAPLAACQSGEGSHIVALLPDARILYVSTKDKKSEIVRLQDGGKFAEAPAVWCSSDGLRFVAALEKQLQVFAVDEQTRQIKADFAVTASVSRPLVALAESLMVLADPEQATTAFMGKLNGSRLSSLQFPTGLKPVWIGVQRIGPDGTLHIIGKQSDPLSEAAEYSLSAHIGFDRRMQYTTQSIDGLITTESVFAPSGRAVAFEKDNQWHVALQRELSNSPLQLLDGITRDLIEESSLDQIDAAWTYLRTEPFHKLGEYPDQASETFFELMARNISMYGWKHGGDLEARADLLMDRWAKLAPQSLFVPTLKAMRERDRAWKARGTGFANTVTEQGAKEFQERMLAVAALLKPLFKEKHPPTRAFSLAFDVSMSLGLPLEVTKNLNKAMMQTPVKYSTTAHAAVVLLLLPRWHGNPGDSEYYITTIADELGGDVGDCMYAQLFLYAARFHPSDQPLSVHLNYDAERLLRGLKVYYQSPQSADHLQRALTVFAAEEYWDLYKKALQLQTEARVFLDEVDSKLLARRATEQSKALGSN